MKARAIIIIAIAGLLIAAAAQATDVSGNQYGVWNMNGSPYNVTGNITVPGGYFLTIMPGVQVRFNGNFNITVNGGLAAHGQEGDSVRFIKNGGAVPNWQYLKFNSGAISDSCLLDYCNMEGGANAVWASGTRVTVRHSHIKYFSDTGIKGAAYYSSYASLTVSNCNIHNCAKGVSLENSAESAIGTLAIRNTMVNYSTGTGVLLDRATLDMDTCTIINSGLQGNGISISNGGSVSIQGGLIKNNGANGIYAYLVSSWSLHDLEISHNGLDGITVINVTTGMGNMNASRLLIHDNHDNGMQLTYTGMNAHNLTISGNGTPGLPPVGSGISSIGAIIQITSSIVDRNQIYGVYLQSGTGYLSYDDFYGNLNTNVYGATPGFGCISLDPLYVSQSLENFNLQAESPCIDAGYIGDPMDPDSTITDMGALYFNQSAAVEPLPDLQEAPTDFHLLPVSPNPFNASTVARYELRVASQVRLTVWDATGRLVSTLVDEWQPAGVYRESLDGSRLASGTYYLRLEAGKFRDAVSCTLVK